MYEFLPIYMFMPINRFKKSLSHKDSAMATILFLLNKTRDSLVGLEYLVEVKNTNRLNYFCCVLCDLEFENHSNTVRHMVSFKHRVEYLVSLFGNCAIICKHI